MESLDYRYYNICINSHSAKANKDGSLTVVVAHKNPGVANWIETAGHVEGTMCWRWYRPETDPPKSIGTRLVAFDELKKILHADS